MEKMTDKDTLADNNIKDFHESPKYAYCDLCAMNGYNSLLLNYIHIMPTARE